MLYKLKLHSSHKIPFYERNLFFISIPLNVPTHRKRARKRKTKANDRYERCLPSESKII